MLKSVLKNMQDETSTIPLTLTYSALDQWTPSDALFSFQRIFTLLKAKYEYYVTFVFICVVVGIYYFAQRNIIFLPPA